VHALATFLTLRAFEFIRTDVGIGRLPVKLVGGVPGFLSEANGPTHQAIDDVAVMRAIPGMEIFCPADAAELAAGLPVVLASPAPTYIRFTRAPRRSSTRRSRSAAPRRVGRRRPGRAGGGPAVPAAADACASLHRDGIGARLVNLRTLAPSTRAPSWRRRAAVACW